MVEILERKFRKSVTPSQEIDMSFPNSNQFQARFKKSKALLRMQGMFTKVPDAY
jgi:hypothetical protein